MCQYDIAYLILEFVFAHVTWFYRRNKSIIDEGMLEETKINRFFRFAHCF